MESRRPRREFAVKTSDGGILLVNDEASGVGVFKLMPEQQAPTPTPAPTPAPAPSPTPSPAPAPEQQVVEGLGILWGTSPTATSTRPTGQPARSSALEEQT